MSHSWYQGRSAAPHQGLNPQMPRYHEIVLSLLAGALPVLLDIASITSAELRWRVGMQPSRLLR